MAALSSPDGDVAPGGPTVRLDRVQAEAAAARASLLVLGGAGTGKSTCIRAATLVQSRRCGPQRVLGITHDRTAARHWQARAAHESAGLAPRVVTVAALAADILAETGAQERLLTAPEQELRVRELLAGSASSGSVDWPAEWKPAITTRGFARQLRRAVSHVRRLGWEPADLAREAERLGDHTWRAVAQFTDEYLQVLDWEGSLDYVEAVLRALHRVRSDSWRGPRPQVLLIDDAQDLAALEMQLLRAVLGPAGILIAAADPDQAVWSFRGADLAAVADIAASADCVTLPRCYRGSAAQREARARLHVGRWYPGLPLAAAAGHRTPAMAGETRGRLELLQFDDLHAQTRHIAAMLADAFAAGTPWRDMAVLSADPAAISATIQGLAQARIPATVPADDLPLAAQPAVAALLAAARLAIDWGRRPLHPDAVDQVLASELGGLSASDLRGLRTWLRSRRGERAPAPDLASLLADASLRAQLPTRMGHTARRLGDLTARIAAAARAERAGQPPAEVLWLLWDGPWPRRLRERALAPGPGGIAADRDLDAVLGLFRLAQRAPQRWGGTRGLGAFLAEVVAQEIAAEPDLKQRRYRDSVTVTSLLRAKGREWPLVIVTGVQESVFAGSPPPVGLFELDRLTAAELLGVPAAPKPGEQRRLLTMALGRSRSDLILCAAGGADDPPADMAAAAAGGWRRVTGLPTQPRTPAQIIAQLRAAARVPGSRAGAARSAARLMAATDGRASLIPAADVRRWPGVSQWTAAPAPLRGPDEPLLLSASAVESIAECPRRWFLAREVRATRPSGAVTRFGLIVHDAVAALIGAEDPAAVNLRDLLDQRWDSSGYDADWHAAAEHDMALAALRRARAWLDSRGGAVAAEVAVDVELDVAGPAGDDTVRLTGSIDAVERGDDGREVVWDFKTRRTRFTRQQVADSLQLSTYQAAVQAAGGTSAGAGFVQLCLPAGAGDPGPLALQQAPLEQSVHSIQLAAAAAVVRNEAFPAQPGTSCRTCEFRRSCPAPGVRP
jgi:superfamily I DNA/RNA helicase/RecB family exonuclease